MNNNETAVIIPAYNEGKNLQILVTKITNNFPGIEIVIVDDSQKEENLLLKKALANFKKVTILSREKKQGRGSAVIFGMKEALKNKKNKYFFEMDADLAHDPLEFPQFFSASEKYDMVVGSRYLTKSRIIKWPLYRLVQSKVINFLLKYWLGIKLSDYTNGFRLYKRSAVEFIVVQKLKEAGYISLSEIAFKLKKARLPNGQRKFKIGEVPTSFTDRTYGKSNADAKELLRSLVGAVRIRLNG
ncbi:glycosyltransferase [Candidatus Microgenomates bacterium]|nr:glycosyltransferase [Candidatus Microgenomates bacterium]